MLHQPLPEKIWFYPIDKASNTATFRALDSNFRLRFRCTPFSVHRGCTGWWRSAQLNLPASSAATWTRRGQRRNTLYLPVNVPGALLYMGDGHAAMGDGEWPGRRSKFRCWRECSQLIKGKKISLPFRDNYSIMAVGAYRPLDDALRIAFTELVDWIHKNYGFPAWMHMAAIEGGEESIWTRWWTRTTWCRVHRQDVSNRKRSRAGTLACRVHERFYAFFNALAILLSASSSVLRDVARFIRIWPARPSRNSIRR